MGQRGPVWGRLRLLVPAFVGAYIFICAYGRVGRTVSRELEAEGVPFVVIDRDESLEERMRSDGILHVIADPSSEAILLEVGIERARGLVCAVDSDAQNVFITLTARSLNTGIYIVGRASEPESEDLTTSGWTRATW